MPQASSSRHLTPDEPASSEAPADGVRDDVAVHDARCLRGARAHSGEDGRTSLCASLSLATKAFDYATASSMVHYEVVLCFRVLSASLSLSLAQIPDLFARERTQHIIQAYMHLELLEVEGVECDKISPLSATPATAMGNFCMHVRTHVVFRLASDQMIVYGCLSLS